MSKNPLSPQDVWNVLAGRSAAGEPRLQRSLSFPRSEEVRHELERFIVNLGWQMRSQDTGARLRDVDRTMLITKIASWLVSTGRANVAGIRAAYESMPHIAEATINYPEWSRRCGVAAAILLAQSREFSASSLADQSQPPTVCWQGPTSVLLELTTAAHLIEQGRLAGNCLGSCCDGVRFNADAEPAIEDAPVPLRYLRLIRTGRARLFALRSHDSRSLATIEYDVKRRYISTFEVTRREGLSRIEALAHVFAAFQSMRMLVQLASDGMMLDLVARCLRGEPRALSDDKPALALASVVVLPDISEETLARLFGFSHLRVDLTPLPRNRYAEIPSRVACHLYSDGSVWPSQLHTILGSVEFPGLRETEFTELAYCGDIACSALTRGSFPNLEVVRGNVLLESLEHGAFPKLHTVLGIENFGYVSRTSLPCLTPDPQGEAGRRRHADRQLPAGMTLRLARMLEAQGGTQNAH